MKNFKRKVRKALRKECKAVFLICGEEVNRKVRKDFARFAKILDNLVTLRNEGFSQEANTSCFEEVNRKFRKVYARLAKLYFNL